jgi:hypothetical protein
MPNRKRSPPATRRRALELLAASRDGCAEAIMLATAKAEGVIAGRQDDRGRPRSRRHAQ